MLIRLIVITTVAALMMCGAAKAGDEGRAAGYVPRAATVAETIVGTWTCQDQLGAARTRASRSPWSLPRGPYRAWVLNLWKLRRASCLDTLHERGRIWRRLQHGLAGSPMQGTEKELEQAGRRYGISPYFIAAIAATESTLGAHACGPHGYNAWGLANCDGRWDVPTFNSWEEAYLYMGRFLSQRWPTAIDPYDYVGYAKCSSCWGDATANHMRRLFGVGTYVRYPGTPPG